MVVFFNLVVYISLSCIAGFYATSFQLSSWFLQGLHYYLYPENPNGVEQQKNQSGNGYTSTHVKAHENTLVDANDGDTAGRQSVSKEENRTDIGKQQDNGSLLYKRAKKRKEKTKDQSSWDEGSSQLLRLTLVPAHLQGRLFFQDYDKVIVFSLVGLTNLLACEVLTYFTVSNPEKLSRKNDLLRNDKIIPVFMGLFAVYKIVRALARVGWQGSTSRISELTVSICVGFVGFIVALYLLHFAPVSVIDFALDKLYLHATRTSDGAGFESMQSNILSPTFINAVMALAAGCLTGMLVVPAHHNVRAFWLGTDQLQWNMPVLRIGRIVKFMLHLNVVLPLFASIIWIKPMGELFISSKPSVELSTIREAFEPTEQLQELHIAEETGRKHTEEERPTQLDEGPVADDQSTGPSDLLQQGGEHNVKKLTLTNGKVDHAGSLQISFWGKLLLPAHSADDWAQDFGMLETTLRKLQYWGLFATGLLQLCLFRVCIQIYLNEAVLVWYESLHRSKTNNLELTRAKLLLNSYFICRAAVQLFCPGMMMILFLGMSRVWESHTIRLADSSSSLLLFRGVALFMAWWVAFSWALLTCIILGLYRIGFFLAT